MNILILNWRDIKNPAGGGAEILTHEMAKRWVKAGHNVTQFSSAFINAKREEKIDGVQFIRRGKWWNVHLLAIPFYFKNRKKYDVVIDEVHWFPFFAALYAPQKTIALTCEVASKLLFRIFPYPIAIIFLFIERLYLLFYRKVPTMVISQSTKEDLLAAGHFKENVIILPMGITVPKKVKIFLKEKVPTLISVGRLNKQKGTLDLIEAFSAINKAIPKSTLWLVGSGEKDFSKLLEERIDDLGLKNKVKMWGFVSEVEKFTLLSKSHVLISASMQEGWGLTIPEAGYVKTPSVVYNIPGFRDIIIQNKTGYLVNTNPDDLANKTVTLLQDSALYTNMQHESHIQAKSFTWDKTAEIALDFINKYINYDK